MTFEEFEQHAREAWDEIPVAYKEGVDGLTVRRDAPVHPDHEEVYTLGECLTEEHVSDSGSADTTRSIIALYWGSFQALAARNPDFDWEEEAWETLTHELRHHLESLAGDDALEGVDYAADETFKRLEDEPFDPWYWQHGDVIEPDDGVAAVGSGSGYAIAAARALLSNTDLPAAEIADRALRIAAEICIYTNDHVTVVSLP